jgi:hypothetical protein
MMDRRSPWIHLALTVWTVMLVGLVLVEIGRLPLGLTAVLVPYLTLTAWHWIGHLRQPEPTEPALLSDDTVESPADIQPDEAADSPGSGDCPGNGDASMTTLSRPTEESIAPPTRWGRARRRSRALEPEPSSASWVQVRPGRFVRVDEMAPEHPAEGSGGDTRIEEPHGDTSPDTPGLTPDAGSIPNDADSIVVEPEPGRNHAVGNAPQTGVPGDGEIPERSIAGSLATTTYLIGRPSGDPDDPGSSPPTSVTRPEVDSDDRGEDMFRAERSEMDLGREEPIDLTRPHA